MVTNAFSVVALAITGPDSFRPEYRAIEEDLCQIVMGKFTSYVTTGRSKRTILRVLLLFPLGLLLLVVTYTYRPWDLNQANPAWLSKGSPRTKGPLSIHNDIVVSKEPRPNRRHALPDSVRCSVSPGRLSVAYRGRLGNLMFEYASMYAIARRLGMVSTLHRESKLIAIFKVDPDEIGNISQPNSTVKESMIGRYDTRLLRLPCFKDTVLCCHLESWKYFEGYETEIRSQFEFRPGVMRKARSVWDTAILRAAKAGKMKRGNCRTVFVAVHVRRGDKAYNDGLIAYGSTVATRAYLENGYRFFQNKFNNSVQFVVSTDDPGWVRKVLPSSVSVFVDSDSPEVDMAVLSLCNHTLMTVGTFGWWVAWLVNGITVYYKRMYRPGSRFGRRFNGSLDDFVLPNWIEMS